MATRTGRPASSPEDPAETTVVLQDPRALRALAHPARQRLVAELFAGNVLTATEAAALVGLTPSAVSHHLRALAKYGLATRAEATADGRERPWRATGTYLNLPMPSGLAAVRATQTVTRATITTATEEVDALLEGRVGEPWTGHRLSREVLRLTEKETEELSAELSAVIDRFATGRRGGRYPTSGRRTALTVMFLPLEPAPEEPAPE